MHRLKLNDDNIQLIYLVSLNNTKSISIEPITVGDISIPPTSSARNIGVIFESTFQMVNSRLDYCNLLLQGLSKYPTPWTHLWNKDAASMATDTAENYI